MHTCKHYDCGWCYAPEGLDTNASGQGGCGGMLTCPQASVPDLPPINLNVLPSADNFYPDREVSHRYCSECDVELTSYQEIRAGMCDICAWEGC